MRRITKLEKKLKQAKESNNNSLISRCEESNGELPQCVSDATERMTYEQQTSENVAFELSEKDEEIRILKERCDARYQRIKTLEQEKADLSEQAKQFEINYRVEDEENKSLKAKLAEMNVHLDHLSSITDYEENDLDDERTRDFRKAISILKNQVKVLNDDLAKLRDHSKDQSKQILTLRQQVEVTTVSVFTTFSKITVCDGQNYYFCC